MENANLVAIVGYTDQKGESKQRLVTTSVQVALLLARRHDNVLRDIRKLVAPLTAESDETRHLPAYLESLKQYFTPTEHTDERGKVQPSYLLTEAGLAMLIGMYRTPEAKRISQQFTAAFFSASEEQQHLKDKKDKELRQELSRLHSESQDGTFHTLREERDRFKVERDTAERRLWEIEQNPIEKYSKSVQDRTFQLAEEKARKLYAPALREVYKEMTAVYDIAQEFADYISVVGSKPQDEWVDKPSGHLRRRAGQLTNRRLKCALRASVGPDGLAEGLRRWLQEPCDIVVAE